MNRELGFASVVAYGNEFFREGTGPIWMDEVDCDGDEDTLSNCSFPGWEPRYCYHYEDVGVKCGLSKYYNGTALLILGWHKEFAKNIHNSHQRY